VTAQVEQPVVGPLTENNEHDRNWISREVAPIAKRRHIGAQLALFASGDMALNYYFVEAGNFLVTKCRERRRTGDPVAAIQFLSHGDVFIFNCGNRHFVDCVAVTDSVVLSVDRVLLQKHAVKNPDLSHALSVVHANELGWMIQSLRTHHDPMGDKQPNPRFGTAFS
jgi:CRP-like cAMP-binding protein